MDSLRKQPYRMHIAKWPFQGPFTQGLSLTLRPTGQGVFNSGSKGHRILVQSKPLSMARPNPGSWHGGHEPAVQDVWRTEGEGHHGVSKRVETGHIYFVK
jgi:hypothetical protein